MIDSTQTQPGISYVIAPRIFSLSTGFWLCRSRMLGTGGDTLTITYWIFPKIGKVGGGGSNAGIELSAFCERIELMCRMCMIGTVDSLFHKQPLQVSELLAVWQSHDWPRLKPRPKRGLTLSWLIKQQRTSTFLFLILDLPRLKAWPNAWTESKERIQSARYLRRQG
jgi:hypothetical protein